MCLVGHFEEQILRFLAVYLQQHPDLVVSLYLLHYGSSSSSSSFDDAENDNVSIITRIVNGVLLDFQLARSRIRYHMAADVTQLDLSALRHCDILHIEDIQRQNADLGYAYTPTKTIVSPHDGHQRMVSLSDVYAILRRRLAELQRQRQLQRQQPQSSMVASPKSTIIIYTTDEASSFDRITIPSINTIPMDLQSSLTWLGSAVVFDGMVEYDVAEMWTTEEVPHHIASSCGRLVRIPPCVYCVYGMMSVCDSLCVCVCLCVCVHVCVFVWVGSADQLYRGCVLSGSSFDHVRGAIGSPSSVSTTRSVLIAIVITISVTGSSKSVALVV